MTSISTISTSDIVTLSRGRLSYDGSYSIVLDSSTYERAAKMARGSYQLAILSGSEAISGGTLRGRAKSYGGRYAASAKNFLARCERAGIDVMTVVGPHGRRVVVFA
jgi:hypothetical protein